MKTHAKVTLCTIALAIAVILFLQIRNPGCQSGPGQKEDIAPQATVPRVAPVSTPPNDQPAGPAAFAPVEAAQPDESSATLRMYAAHAPLRVPEVADPDSQTNRQILQTMVQKALQRRAMDAPENSPNSAQ